VFRRRQDTGTTRRGSTIRLLVQLQHVGLCAVTAGVSFLWLDSTAVLPRWLRHEAVSARDIV
jgi:hypothetical protein